jgi:hypothetical protein
VLMSGGLIIADIGWRRTEVSADIKIVRRSKAVLDCELFFST